MGLTKVAYELNELYRFVRMEATDWIIDGVRSEFGVLNFASADDVLNIETFKLLNTNGVHSYINRNFSDSRIIFVHDDSFVTVLKKLATEIENLTSEDLEVLQESKKGEMIVSQRNQLISLSESFDTVPMDLIKIQSNTDANAHYLSSLRSRVPIINYQEALEQIMKLSIVANESEIDGFSRHLTSYLEKL